MCKDDFFGFDMLVLFVKKKNLCGCCGMLGVFEIFICWCDYKGCEEVGKYCVFKLLDIFEEYFWFCKDYVCEYNLKWNFFDGVIEEEYMEQVDKDCVWEWEIKLFGKNFEEQCVWVCLGVDDLYQVLGDNVMCNLGKNGKVDGSICCLLLIECCVLEILEVKDIMFKVEICKVYKKLIKVLYFDMNGGDCS